MDNKDNSLLVFLLGAIIGAAAGILYAPKSGKETRQELKKLGADVSDAVSDFSGDLKETGRRIYSEGREKILCGKEKLSEAIEEGKRAFEKYKEED
ncbi:MAG: YtxH domain-containing protein [Elusimicrobiota bacterium]|jgi:gas vesicle protein|nr:YtxH domain-containing protein [Elusimicrobiota bacterium]